MKVNHENTRINILKITELLKKLAGAATKYINDKLAVEMNDTISQKYQQEQIEELRVNYLSLLQQTKKEIREILDIITEYENEQDKIIEFDVPEYINTIATINATKGELPENVIKNIKYNFAGQYNNLISIKALFDLYDVNVLNYGYAEYVKSAKDALSEIDIMAKNIETSEQSIFIDLRKIFTSIITFGEVRGIKFADVEKDFGELDNPTAQEMLVNKVMGIK